jgi:hypothetical protein
MPASIAKKLQLRDGQSVRLINPPAGFEIDGHPSDSKGDALLLFAQDGKRLNDMGKPVIEAAKKDRLAWIAYPKAGKLGTDLNRDKLAEMLKAPGLRPVRLVSLDDTWAAMRFRPI